MLTYTGPTPSAQGLTKPVDCVSSQQAQCHDYQAHCQKDGETGVVVHDGQHSPSLLKFSPRSSELEFTAEFHPVFPLFLRDGLDVGVGSTGILPADKSCKQSCPRVIQFPLAVPPPTQLGNAMAIASHPEVVYDRPLLRRLAWSTLMAARGHRVNQTRLAQLQRGMAL
jgi:hypothetical protein